MLKKIIALFLALLLASFALAACKKDPTPPVTDDPSDPNKGTETKPLDSGKIGDSALTWELYEDGTLYIKGSGAMPEMEKGEGDSVIQPWHEYANNQSGTAIKSLVVKDGVTSLAANAFYNCTKLKSVEIANSVSVLPEKCFKYCESLQKVRARGVVRIEDNAFDSCVKLDTVTFSALLEFVGDGAFLRAGEEASSFSVRLAGTASEWLSAKAKMDANESDEFAIWTGNEKLIAGLETPAFVDREDTYE